MEAPIQVKPIPPQVVNERASYGPFNLKDYIQSPSGQDPVHFQAELTGGAALPQGMICTSDGILTGIPAKETEGLYEVLITAKNEAGSIEAKLILTIKPSLLGGTDDYINKLKAQVWEALEQHLPIPDLAEMYDRPITQHDIYYLLERWGILTIWDAFNLEPPSDKILLTLEEANPHYNIYDRGSCLVACPKDLFSRDRTLADGLQTARVMAREAYHRNWTIELVGFDKLVRAAWVELQLLGDQFDKRPEVINYTPTTDDIRLYNEKDLERRMQNPEL